jgi:sugar/nucleoside kinase (ribokinase family)
VIVVVGSLALDSVKTPLGTAEAVLGGSGAYFALAARLFAPVSLVAVVGRDFPPAHLELLAKQGVDVAPVERAPGESFRWGGEYSEDLNQRTTLFTHLNVFETFAPKLDESLRAAPYLFLANIDPGLQSDVLDQMRKPALVACDTMNYWIASKRPALVETLRRVQVCILNDGEARELSGESNLWRAADAILALGPKIVVVKKGEHGAILASPGERFTSPAYPLEMVYDPTGAGDTFAGGFIGYLAAEGAALAAGSQSATTLPSAATLRRAVVYGTVAASFSVERFSVDGLLGITRADLDRRARELLAIARWDHPEEDPVRAPRTGAGARG